MRELVKEFVKIVAENLPISEPIVEFGSLQVSGHEGFADLRSFFATMEYVGCDMQEGTGVDRVLDLHNIDLPSESAGTVLIMDTLEHVAYPVRALEEVFRILKIDGLVIISSVMNFPIHEFPNDYWRFTPEGFRVLLNPFSSCFVEYAGIEGFPHTVVGIGSKGRSIDRICTCSFDMKFKGWKRRWCNPDGSTARWKRIVKGITPPILLPMLKYGYGKISKQMARKFY